MDESHRRVGSFCVGPSVLIKQAFAWTVYINARNVASTEETIKNQ